MPGEAASHLFQVISRRYEHGSIILTTNRGITDLGSDLRRHDRRDRRPRPPTTPRLGPLRDPATATRMRRHRDAINALRPGPHRPPRKWGIPMITTGESQ